MFSRRQWNGMPRREAPSIFMDILISSPSSHTDPNLFPAHESPATQRTFMDTRFNPKEKCFLLGIFFLRSLTLNCSVFTQDLSHKKMSDGRKKRSFIQHCFVIVFRH
ncbi:hypothetical protein CDAR_559261 [Caerostris darwini]|uniref:Uncharacterized protein n=1 Tax=Caerostris darwini TaxID=1538125 RepID=A0AAV4NZ61_9ARAC|nr:hypothetical protein CDAR_559261 [Caerostris darwini]